MQGRVRHVVEAGRKPIFDRLWASRHGATLVEYSMLGGVIGAMVILVIMGLRSSLDESWQQVADATHLANSPAGEANRDPAGADGSETIVPRIATAAVAPVTDPATSSIDSRVAGAMAALDRGEEVDILGDIAPAAGAAEPAVVQAPTWSVGQIWARLLDADNTRGRGWSARLSAIDAWAISILSFLAVLVLIIGEVHARYQAIGEARDRLEHHLTRLT